ncbi:hypothetical protein ACFOUO_04945 [Salinithrix halophila]|uniref:Uncharacterized protein n=1 Tax=Salinithrix halophila TaxID=1485204 RepID=A0ABV8JB98_9BACL
MFIQIEKHANAVQYLQGNLYQLPEAKKMGILESNQDIQYMIKAPDFASDKSLAKIKAAFQEYGYPVK